jgi:hypothetical protein
MQIPQRDVSHLRPASSQYCRQFPVFSLAYSTAMVRLQLLSPHTPNNTVPRMSESAILVCSSGTAPALIHVCGLVNGNRRGRGWLDINLYHLDLSNKKRNVMRMKKRTAPVSRQWESILGARSGSYYTFCTYLIRSKTLCVSSWSPLISISVVRARVCVMGVVSVISSHLGARRGCRNCR